MKKLQIGIIGSAGPEEYRGVKPDSLSYTLAYEVGTLVAKLGAILICGGKGGIMEAACRGAKEYDGITVGVISGNQRFQANAFVDVEVVSGMVNCGEDSIIVSMSDGIIAIAGGAGTLQELTLAYRNGKPTVAMVNLQGWSAKVAGTYLDERKTIKIASAITPEDAVRLILRKIKSSIGTK